MLNFHSRTSPPHDFSQTNLPTKDKSKIPFLFAAIPHKLFDKGLKPATVGIYSGLARYVNLKMQMTIGDRKVITGWTPPISQKTLARLLNTTRQTVIQHLKILVQAGVVELKQSFRGCYQYRLIAYKEGIEQLKKELREQEEQTDHQATNPAAPTPEQVDGYVQSETEPQSAQTQSTQTQRTSQFQDDVKNFNTACQELRHIKEILRNIKNNTLSSGGGKDTEAETPEEWREFEKYAFHFYSENLRSKKLLREASRYFKEKVEDYGICEDGFDVVWEMIPVIKKLGAKTHKAFDTEYGIRAFNKVMDRRDYQRQRQAYQQEQQPSSPDDNSNKPQTDTASDEPFDDEQRSSSDNVPPHPSAHPKSAKEVVASQIHTRHCLASIGFKQAYTDEEIEALWVAAYERFGAPSTAEEWVEDRLYVRKNLVQHEVEDPYSDEEIEALMRRAREL